MDGRTSWKGHHCASRHGGLSMQLHSSGLPAWRKSNGPAVQSSQQSRWWGKASQCFRRKNGVIKKGSPAPSARARAETLCESMRYKRNGGGPGKGRLSVAAYTNAGGQVDLSRGSPPRVWCLSSRVWCHLAIRRPVFSSISDGLGGAGTPTELFSLSGESGESESA